MHSLSLLQFLRASVLGLLLLPLLLSGGDRATFLEEMHKRREAELTAETLPLHAAQEQCDAFLREYRLVHFHSRDEVARILRPQAERELARQGIDIDFGRHPFQCSSDDFISYQEIVKNIQGEFEATRRSMIEKAQKDVKDPDFLAKKIQALCQERASIQSIGNMGEYNNINLEIPWNLCLKEPARKLQELYDQVFARVQEKVKWEFQLEKKLADLQKAGRQKFKLFKPKQKVDLSYTSAGKIPTILKGYLMKVTPDRIQVGQKVVLRQDLPEEILAFFYEDVNQKIVEQFVEENRVSLDQEVVALCRQQMEEALPPVLLENGFVPTLRFGSLQGNLYLKETWISMKEYGTILQAHILQSLIEEINRERIVAYMKEQGYFFDVQEEVWTSQKAKDYVMAIKPYLELVSKTQEAKGWKLVKDEKARLGYLLLTPFAAYQRECQAAAKEMRQMGYQQKDWLPDYPYWSTFILN